MSELLSGTRETVHLFAVDLPEDQLWAFIDHDRDAGTFPLRDALGVDQLDDKQIEGAVAEDLAGIGLSGFMIEGVGVDETAIAADRARIDALTGAVVLVKGAAFDGAQVPLTPKPPLTHVGSWQMTPAADTFEPLQSDSAKGDILSAPPTTPAPTGPRDRMTLWIMVGIFLLILIAVVIGAVL